MREPIGEDEGMDFVWSREDMSSISIITTASIPWLTGTAILPLSLAACLAEGGHDVTLFVPWLGSRKAQRALFPPGMTFSTPEEQEAQVQEWLEGNFPGASVKVDFYPAGYVPAAGSTYPAVNLAKFLPGSDILLLVEPEHLFFIQPWNLGKLKAARIYGLLISNYSFYLEHAFGKLAFLVMPLFNRYDLFLKKRVPLTIRASSAARGPASCAVIPVNGALPKFFATPGDGHDGHGRFSRPFCFMGKLEWFKGFKELADLWSDLPPEIKATPVDCYGQGSRTREIVAHCRGKGLELNVRPPTLFPEEALAPYRAFINASISETLCTTSLNALAMGKWLVVPRHPSNEFFYRFSNCLTYDDKDGFAEALDRTLAEDPAPLPPEEAHALSWNGAMERLMAAIESPPGG